MRISRNAPRNKQPIPNLRNPVYSVFILNLEFALVLTGHKQKSTPNVAQTVSIRRKHVRIQVEPINK